MARNIIYFQDLLKRSKTMSFEIACKDVNLCVVRASCKVIDLLISYMQGKKKLEPIHI